LLLGALFVAPLAMVLQGGLVSEGRWTTTWLAAVFRNPVYVEGLGNSALIATATTALAAALGLPLAWLATRRDFFGRRVVTAAILLPMVLPPFVGAIGVQQILGRRGALNAALGLEVDWLGAARMAAVIALEALALYPVVFLNVSAALANVDPAMEEAAENLGCRGWAKFRRITLPLIWPGLFAGGAIVWIWSFTELGTPLMLGFSRCAPVQVYDALKEIGTNPRPFALVAVMMATCLAVFVSARLLVGRYLTAMPTKGAAAAAPQRLTGRQAAAALAAFAAVGSLALAPHAGVVLTSVAVPGTWYGQAWPGEWTAAHLAEALGHDLAAMSIRNSLLYSAGAVVLAVALGLAISTVVVRSDLRWRGGLDAMATLPLAVPGLVMAFGYLALSARLSHLEWVRSNPAARAMLDVRTHPAFFLIVAYAVRRLPYVVRSITAGLQQVPSAYEEAAAALGCPPGRTLRRITLPLISANVVAGGLLTFAFSMLEVSDSLLLAQRMDFYPITKTIYELNSLIGTGPHLAAALGLWAMAFLAAAIATASRLLGRRMGTLFRL